MRISLLITFTLFLNFCTVSLFGQCNEIEKSFPYKEGLGEPVLTGTPVLFPEIKLRVTKRDTSDILPIQEVIMRYVWRHFLVSPKFNINGSWSESYDVIRCTTNDNGVVFFPEYNFVPRAWYDGSKIQSILRGKNLPRFHELELSVENWHYLISKDQIKKIFDNKVKEPIELKNYGNKKFFPPIKVEIIP